MSCSTFLQKLGLVHKPQKKPERIVARSKITACIFPPQKMPRDWMNDQEGRLLSLARVLCPTVDVAFLSTALLCRSDCRGFRANTMNLLQILLLLTMCSTTGKSCGDSKLGNCTLIEQFASSQSQCVAKSAPIHVP